MSVALNKYLDNLRSTFDEVLKIKSRTNAGDRLTEELVEKRRSATLLFVIIKEINRQVKYKLRSGREELHTEKVRVDINRLQLQNLLYEVNHLKREIRQCHQFKSQDEEIDLLPELEYSEMLLPEILPVSGHSKRLMHLESELRLRKQLSAKCKELLNLKNQTFQDIVLKMERLTSFGPSLRTLLTATLPLQYALQIPIDREWKLRKLVQLLPQPLYLVYINIHALEVAQDSVVCITIVGGEEDVHNYELASQLKLHTNQIITFGDTPNDPQGSYISAEITYIMTPHPLIVRFSIVNKKDSEDNIFINLRYFPQLGFVTASTEINLKDKDSVSEDITSSLLLSHLFENDDGNTIPVSDIQYKLSKIQMTPEECLQYLKTKDFGKPYRWLQRMCCLEVHNYIKNESAEAKLHQIIPEIIRGIQCLWSSRLNLLKQIRALVNKNTDMFLKDESLPVSKPSCSLVQWTSVAWEEYVANSSTAPYIESGLVDDSHVFYRAVLVRGSAKMECLISISNKFPTHSPIWRICVYWNGQHNAINNTAIKNMEYWTNCITQNQLEHESALVSLQLNRTMYSFDIFLETEGPLYSPAEYNVEKHCIKAFSKRIRALPYRFFKEGGTINSFKQ